MAGEAVQALVSAGPFLGVNTTLTDIYTSPTKALSMTAGDCEVIPQSLVAKAGRTNLFSAAGLNGGVIGAIAQSSLGEISGVIQDTIMGSVPVSTATPGVAARFIWSQAAGSNGIPYEGGPTTGVSQQDAPFTQAVVIDTPMWNTNTPLSGGGAANLTSSFADSYGTQTNVQVAKAVTGNNQLHYFPPNAFNINAAAATTGGGSMTAGTYTYSFTITVLNQAGTTVAGNTSYELGAATGYGQETSPTLALGSVTVGAPNNSIVLTISGPAGQFSSFSGSMPYDTTAKYVTNVNRSSVAQPAYFYVGTATGATFTDGFADGGVTSGLFLPSINVNQQMTLNRDPAPVKANYDWLNVNPAWLYYTNSNLNYGSYGNTAINTYFQGAPMCGHQGRLWYLAAVQNSDTNFTTQFQLWYSNLNRKWEFDKVNNVFLIDQSPWTWPTNPGPVGSVSTVAAPSINPYLYPNNLYLEMPSAMLSLGSVLMFWTTQRMFTLFGNSPATYVFQVAGNIGCSSLNSVTYAATEQSVGAFWMSENGIYFTNGSSYQYVSEDIRSVIDSLSPQDRYTCVGFYANHTYHISFPQLNQTWAYRTTTSQWHGPMPYSTTGVSDIPSDPVFGNISTASLSYNSAIAIRPNSLHVDTWFSQVDTDLSLPQTLTYQSNDQGTIAAPSIVQAGLPVHIEKEYTILTFVNKPVTGVAKGTLFATVTLTVDDDPTKFCTVQFDLTLGPVQIATMSYQGSGNVLRGYVGALTITYSTSAAVTNMPIQIKNVTVYGKAAQRNLTPTVGMS